MSQPTQSAQIRVRLVGCDDETCIEMGATETELEFLQRLKTLLNAASSYPCMPTIDVQKLAVSS